MVEPRSTLRSRGHSKVFEDPTLNVLFTKRIERYKSSPLTGWGVILRGFSILVHGRRHPLQFLSHKICDILFFWPKITQMTFYLGQLCLPRTPELPKNFDYKVSSSLLKKDRLVGISDTPIQHKLVLLFLNRLIVMEPTWHSRKGDLFKS